MTGADTVPLWDMRKRQMLNWQNCSSQENEGNKDCGECDFKKKILVWKPGIRLAAGNLKKKKVHKRIYWEDSALPGV